MIASSSVLVAALTAGSWDWTSCSGALKYLWRKLVRVHSEALRWGQSVAFPQRRSLRSPAVGAGMMFREARPPPPLETLEELDEWFERVLCAVVMVHERGLYTLPLLTPGHIADAWRESRDAMLLRHAEGFMDVDHQ